VSIIDAENGRYEIHRRVKSLGLPSEGVELHEPEGFDLRHDLADLERVLEADRPDLLVLDAYRSLWGGEENDSREVAAVLDPLRNLVRRFDVGALLLHHSGKGNGGYRGSSAIGASAELGFTLARDPGDPESRRGRPKAREGGRRVYRRRRRLGRPGRAGRGQGRIRPPRRWPRRR
jgi:hypothetical protein